MLLGITYEEPSESHLRRPTSKLRELLWLERKLTWDESSSKYPEPVTNCDNRFPLVTGIRPSTLATTFSL